MSPSSGGGIVDNEFAQVIFDSLAIVVPAALAVILGLLAYAYRDPFDFVLGGVALLMTVVWTFGFTGYAGIAFSDVLIAVPVLLLAIGIDFGIHTVNRYREERAGVEPTPPPCETHGQLTVAYSIIAGTTIIGFLANLTSSLGPLQEFGLVAGIGICFIPSFSSAFCRRRSSSSTAGAPSGRSPSSAPARLAPRTRRSVDYFRR